MSSDWQEEWNREDTQEEIGLRAKLDAIGRPRVSFVKGVLEHSKTTLAREQWDKENPDKAAESKLIVERLDEIRKVERAALASRIAEKRHWERVEELVGKRNSTAVRASLENTESIAAADKFEQSGKCFLLLSGAPGCGKTIAASVLLERALRKTSSVRMVRASECARLSLFDAEDKAAISKMGRATVLAFDDLGVESYHDTWRQIFEDVMDARYQERLRTILTTNLDPAAFKQRYGERIADRIRHDGVIAQCGATSMRRAQ